MESTGLVLQEDNMTTYVVWDRTWKTRGIEEVVENVKTEGKTQNEDST